MVIQWKMLWAFEKKTVLNIPKEMKLTFHFIQFLKLCVMLSFLLVSVFQLGASTSSGNPTLRRTPSGETHQTPNCLVSSAAGLRIIMSCYVLKLCSCTPFFIGHQDKLPRQNSYKLLMTHSTSVTEFNSGCCTQQPNIKPPKAFWLCQLLNF